MQQREATIRRELAGLGSCGLMIQRFLTWLWGLGNERDPASGAEAVADAKARLAVEQARAERAERLGEHARAARARNHFADTWAAALRGRQS